MQQKVTKDEKCVRNIASYEGLSLENESRTRAGESNEGATSVLDGLDTQRELTGQVKERRDKEEELGGATSLYDDFVGVDKEAGLREDARVEVIVGEEETISQQQECVFRQGWDLVEYGDPVPRVLKDARLKERDLRRLLVTSKPIADKAMSPCCLNL
ncbi:hypothetical protein Bca52824_049223 [Brassica carinata]|uniref:Uncharacterized protein n=1 Tax=Brassica carinata TaxID=52824 RepID=A0A8X7USX1_BRACI|nr:hypothetical protein Bca52824_049223 [Brassica carinata]